MLSIQYVFFIVGAITCISLMSLQKRYFDFLSIYVIVLLLYTLPLFFGVVIDVYTFNFIAANPDIYIVMGCVYYVTCLFLLKNNSYAKYNNEISKIDEKLYLNILFLISVLGFLLHLPSVLNSSSKVELLENTNIFYAIIYSTFPVVGFLLALKVKNKKYIILYSLLLIVLFTFGSRRSIALAVMCSFIILMQYKPLRLIEKYTYIFWGVVFLILVVLSKTLYGSILNSGVINGFSNWFNNFEIKFFLTGSEFIGRSTLLNAVLDNDFKTDKWMYFYSFLAILPIPLSFFNYSSSYFNDMFQPVLFPGIHYGMAYNPWAEVYSAFGLPGVIFLAGSVPFVLSYLWRVYCRSNVVLSVIILFIGAILAFWLQRNSLATILAYIRNVIYPLILVYFFVEILKAIVVKRKK